MATMTTQDRYIVQSCNEVMTAMKALYTLHKKLKSELSKAKGGVGYSQYKYAIDGLENAIQGFDTGGRFYSARFDAQR